MRSRKTQRKQISGNINVLKKESKEVHNSYIVFLQQIYECCFPHCLKFSLFSSFKSCPQERFQVKNPPHTYLQKLRSYLDPAVTRKVSAPPPHSLSFLLTSCPVSHQLFPPTLYLLFRISFRPMGNIARRLATWESWLRNSQSRRLCTWNGWLVGDLPLARPCPAPTFLWRRQVEIKAVPVVETGE